MRSRGRTIFETIEVDKKSGRLVITRQEEFNSLGADDVNGIKRRAKLRLMEIVKQVKALKAEAEEIKKLMANIDGVVMEEAGLITPAPVPKIEESQSLPVE